MIAHVVEELIALAVPILTSVWVYLDAKRLGMRSGSIHAALVFLMLVAGLPLYLWRRRRFRTRDRLARRGSK